MIGFFGYLSEYNLLNSVYKLDDIIFDAKTLDYPFIAINDTNNLYASYKLFKTAKTPYIVGMKLDIVHLDIECSILCYALNEKGYQNINILSSTIQLNEHKRIEFKDILPFQEGLYFISSGFESDIDRYINNNNLIEAERRAKDYKDNLTYFSLGLQIQTFNQEINVAPRLKKLGDKLDVMLLPLNYVAYKKEQTEAYDAIIKVQNPNNTRIDDMDLSLITKDELKSRYVDYLEVFDNLKKVYSLFKFKYRKRRFTLPKVPNLKDSKMALKRLTSEGLLKYFKENNIINKQDYYKRLDYELSVIDELGYNDYFLVVWDFVKYAKEQKILVGPGRGSAAGSLVSFCLNITEVDPLKYGLLFERFLNKERKTMPDIDMDFPDDKREEVIDYIKNRYGSNRVVSINTFSRFSARSSIRDICRIKGYTPSETNEIVKILTVQKENLSPYLKEINDLAASFDGLPRQTGTHAAGIILANEDLRYILPLQQGPKIYQAQFEHEDLEDMGLLKIDLLGIRNLNIINRVLELIKEIKNVDLNIKRLPFNDKKTYELLSKGDTLGIFQLESMGMRNVLRKLKPNNFNDIVALLALYRPGPMKNIDTYIKRRNGERFSYIDKSVEPILKETFGIIVYQEQIILIAQHFAGYNLNEADMLRIGVSRKDKQILEQEREKFITRSIKQNHSKELAETIYDYIVRFADYGFNKSHSVAYSIVAYQMAYLKANYYDIFMAVLLSKMGSDSNVFWLISDLRKQGINVLAPNINKSTDEYVVSDEGLIYPISMIKGIGFETTRKILEERNENGEFKNYRDFKERITPFINSKIMDNLIFSGALDVFKMTKKDLFEQKSLSTDLYDELIGDLKETTSEEYDILYLAEMEKEALGFNLTVSPLADILEYVNKNKLVELKDLTFDYKYVKSAGLIRRINEITTKKNELMCFLTITDYLSNVEITVFPNDYKKFNEILKEGNKIYVEINSQSYGGGSWILKNAKLIE